MQLSAHSTQTFAVIRGTTEFPHFASTGAEPKKSQTPAKAKVRLRPQAFKSQSPSTASTKSVVISNAPIPGLYPRKEISFSKIESVATAETSRVLKCPTPIRAKPTQGKHGSSQPAQHGNQRHSDGAHIRRASAKRGNVAEGPTCVKEGGMMRVVGIRNL